VVADLWCEGLPLVGRRRFTDDERTVLEARARKALTRARLLKWLTTLAAVIGSAAVGLLVFGVNPGGLREGASVAFAGLAIAMFVCGCIGTAMEIALGRTLPGRIFFLIAGVVTLIGGPWKFVKVPWLLAVGSVGLGIVFFLGNVMIVLRWAEGRREYRLFKTALEDIAAGEVLIFSADSSEPNVGGPDWIRDAEVLPRSNLALRVDGERLSSWKTLPVVAVAKPPGSAMEAPFHSPVASTFWPNEALSQRHLAQPEIEELLQLRKRILRRIPLGALGSAYFTAVLLRLLVSFGSGRWKNELSVGGWAVAVLVALGHAWKQTALSRRIAADVKERKVLVVRPATGVPAPVAEVLPASRLYWTENGLPARWRTRR